jgi:hypothetical protein
MAEEASDYEVSLNNETQINPTQQEELTGGQKCFTEANISEINSENDVESPVIGEGNQGGVVTTEEKRDDAPSENGSAVRPKRSAKPSLKSVENRMQSDTTKLQRLWDRVLLIIAKNRDSADTVEAIRVAIKEICASFHQ